jgi:osmotically-inducible protein OsmY
MKFSNALQAKPASQLKSQSLMDYRKPIVMVALCAGLALSLQGCVAVIVGGAVMGTMAATDRRSLGAQAEDASIVLKGSGRIEKVVADLGRVSVVSFNRKVLLTGEVKDEKMKKEVEKEISTLAGVSLPITNEIVVAPLSSFGARSNDLAITAKVQASIIDTKDIYVNAVKVHTDRSVVYLMGRVTQRESKIYAEVASRTGGGIRKIVKLFEYIGEDELQELQKKPAPEQKKE